MLADHKGAYQDCPESKIAYVPGDLTADHITTWEHQYSYRSGKYAQADYNFEKPSTKLSAQTNTLVDLPKVSKFEIFDYPGRFTVKKDGESLTKVRMEEQEVAHDVVECASTCRTLFAGGKFKVDRHECKSEEGAAYAITSVCHTASDNTHLGGGGASSYSNSFECVPISVTYRPPRLTPRPTVQGPQTAVVVGPKGEEIHTDKYGRVKVQFHWDRVGKFDENSSCWIRVAQVWAGKKWGAMYIPRVGQEVIVEFLEGDPDAPIITGRVYHAEAMPPYGLPTNKTISTIKSNSSAKGSGFNEIGFDDKKGEEKLFITAEKDREILVKNNSKEKVEGDLEAEVVKTRKLTVTGDETRTLKAKETITVDGAYSLTVKGAVDEVFKSNHSEKTTGNYTLKAKKVVIDASTGITLKVGGSKVDLTPAGVTISGTMIKVEGKATTKVEGKASANFESSGIAIVKGSLLKLN